MARRLKVFRTAAGFHDAFVAAPSRKAALEAWGAGKDLFARGLAEEVTDPALTAEPLAHPGEVIRTLRGSQADQLAALGPPPGKRKQAAKTTVEPRSPDPPPPPPDREPLDIAERALAAARARHTREASAVEARIATLEAERDRLAAAAAQEDERLSARVDRAREAYERAAAGWRNRTGKR